MSLSTNCPHQPYCEMREQTDMRFISQLTRNTFAIILAVLFVRPQGLFGRAGTERV